MVADVSEPKQVILVRKDLRLPSGKMAAQACHASGEAAYQLSETDYEAWRSTGMAKVVLRVDSLEELLAIQKIGIATGITCALITDEGRTCIEPGTITCLGMGPADPAELDKIVGHLRLY